MITKVEGISGEQLDRIKTVVGEAFVSNELFHNWGTEEERRADVLKYMRMYVDYVYESGELYANDDFTGFIGLEVTGEAPKFPQIKMLIKMLFGIKFSKIKSFLRFARQIENSNAKYAREKHIDALMVCVDKAHQGKGVASELVSFAKSMAEERGIPLLFDTDMKSYAEMYEHFGCELYNSVTADNGVTRYSLCYKKK